MPDYQQGKIYTIRCRTDDTLIYVGSTTQSLAKRWGGHKVDSLNELNKNSLIYRTINNNWTNWFIELYELYPCSCKEELCRREGEIIRLIGTLNIRIEGRTLQEWNEENKDKINEYFQKYYENNKDKINENCKKYYDENKEYFQKYRNENKDKLNEIITCECGCKSTKNNLNRHLKSKRHIDLMAVQELPQPPRVLGEGQS